MSAKGQTTSVPAAIAVWSCSALPGKSGDRDSQQECVLRNLHGKNKRVLIVTVTSGTKVGGHVLISKLVTWGTSTDKIQTQVCRKLLICNFFFKGKGRTCPMNCPKEVAEV